MKENIFNPCGMYNSTFLINDVPQRLATSPHVFSNNCYFDVSEIYPYNRSHAGSSTLHSNIEDMLKWESVFINSGKFENKEILSTESMKMMLSTQHPHTFDENSSEGLGVFIENLNGKNLIYHSGSDVGYSTYFGIIPQDSVAIVFMSNLHRFVPYDAITNTLFYAVYNLPVLELKKPINLVIAPMICKEGFANARKKFLELQKDSAGKYDFGEYWIKTLGNAFEHLGKMDDAKNVLSLSAKTPPK
jgi:CubicO group peptidase (beta-lactamase class C family)